MGSKKGQKYNIEPKARIKKAFTNIVENRRTEKQALLDAGYTMSTAIKPTQVKKTKSWQILMDRYMPDDKLAKVHNEGLEATIKRYKNNVTTGKVECVGEEPDHAIRHKYLDTAYKIKGRYADNPQGITFNTINITQINNVVDDYL